MKTCHARSVRECTQISAGTSIRKPLSWLQTGIILQQRHYCMTRDVKDPLADNVQGLVLREAWLNVWECKIKQKKKTSQRGHGLFELNGDIY